AAAAPWPLRRCSELPPCRSSSPASTIRLAPAWSRAWHTRAATPRLMVGEYGFGAKWLELLKEIAPGVKRAAVMREAGTAPGGGQFAGIQSVAPSLGVELSPVGVGDVGEMERAVTAFARSPNGGTRSETGTIFTPSSL